MWQSRVYAFLFRKILGPYLTPQSQKRLHNSLNVSLRAGKLELLNVDFDGKVLTEQFLKDGDGGTNDSGGSNSDRVEIEKVHVKRMAVTLSLFYFNHEGKVVENYEDGRARLIARVTLDGVHVFVNVNENQNGNGNGKRRGLKSGMESRSTIRQRGGSDKSTNTNTNSNANTTTSASASASASSPTPTSYMGRMTTSSSLSIKSYLQAAIDSLKLSLDLNDVTIRIAVASSKNRKSDTDTRWNDNGVGCGAGVGLDYVSLNMASIAYRDIDGDDDGGIDDDGLNTNTNGNTNIGNGMEGRGDRKHRRHLQNPAGNNGNEAYASYRQVQKRKQEEYQRQWREAKLSASSRRRNANVQNMSMKEIQLDTITLTVGHQQAADVDADADADVDADAGGGSSSNTDTKETFVEEVMRVEGVSTARMTTKMGTDVGTGGGGGVGVNVEKDVEIMVEPEVMMSAGFDTLQRMNRIMSLITTGKGAGAENSGTSGSESASDSASSESKSDASLVIRKNNKSSHSSEGEVDDREDDHDLGLLANIIQNQHDEHYMDNKMRNQVSNRVMGMTIQDEEDEDEHEDELEDGILLNRDGTIQTGGVEKQTQTQTQTQTQIQMQQEIDDFFDSNDEGFSYYRTVLEASINEDQNNNDVDSGGNRNNLVSMRVHLYLRKALMHLRLDDDGPAAHSCQECLATTMEHLDLSLTDNGSHQNVSMTMSAFGIDCVTSYGDDDDGSHVPFSLLHFMDTSARSDSVYHDAIPVHSVFSMNIDTVQNGEESPEVNIRVSVSPMQLVYRDSTISKVMKGMERISRSDDEDHAVVSAEDDVSTDNSGSNLSCHLTCERLLILVPIQHDVSGEALNRVFQRSGYQCASFEELDGPAWVVESSNFSLDIHKVSESDEILLGENEELHVVASVQRSVVSFVSPLVLEDDNPLEFEGLVHTHKLDLIAIESEDVIDPDAVVKVEFVKTSLTNKTDVYKKRRAKRYFPTVTPLASVKPSQQYDKKDPDLQSSNSFNDSSGIAMKRLKGRDPQTTMLRDVSQCQKFIRVHVPSMAVDISITEKDSLLSIISAYETEDSGYNSDKDCEDRDVQSTTSPVSASFQCDQFSFSIHQLYEMPTKSATTEMQHFNHMLICDGFKSFCFIDGGLKHLRLLSHDMTLYEGREGPNVAMPSMGHSPPPPRVICKQIRERRVNRNIEASAKFFRSKMSYPLSPKTPAVLVDIIIKKDDYHTERAVHVSIYDMTHRFEYESSWIDRVTNAFASKHAEDSATNDVIETREESTLTNLFVTASDCNLDYTSPLDFRNASRVIMRVGEVRVTSNIISPSGPIRVFKSTLADVSVHVTNSRVGHDLENSRLSCAKPVLNSINTIISKSTRLPHSFDDALSRMTFVRVVTLDCLDSTVSMASEAIGSEADCSATLCVGRACIYACKDSFICLTESINELVTNLTMPSADELVEMRRQYEREKSNASYQNGERSVVEHGLESEMPTAREENVDPYLVQKPTLLGDMFEHGLFASSVLEEMEEEMEESIEERSMIDNFFAVKSQHDGQERPQNACQRQSATSTDGWIEINHSWANDPSIPDNEDQAARWYADDGQNIATSSKSVMLPRNTKVIIDGGNKGRRPHVFSRHVPIEPVLNPLADGDMGATKFAGTKTPPRVKLRIIIQEMSLDCRFFDGYDWSCTKTDALLAGDSDTTACLIDTLIDNDGSTTNLFGRSNERLTSQSRRSERYFQLSFSGLKLRLDSFEKAPNHSLSSCVDLSLNDMFLIETVSGGSPVKFFGEWLNDEHPRDCNDGLMMMKIVSMLPDDKFASDGKLMGDESRVTMEFLPLRFFMHQVALRFIRNFFRSENPVPMADDSMVSPPEVFFPIFNVKPFNIKVDYKPKQVDTSALKDGSLVELLNVLPLEDMILRLSEVEMRNITGWGSIICELACNWLQDVSRTQMHKFLTRTTPLHPFATVGDGMKQFLTIPLEEYKQKGDVKKGFRKGTKKLASVVAYETLSVGAKLTGFAAKKLRKKSSRVLKEVDQLSSQQPSTLPRSMNEVSDHAIESLTRGLKEANAKMIIIPYRQYQQSGTRGAVTSVVRGLPVAVCAPLSGAAEAVSYGLYGVRNQLRPDLREEEEASKRLHDLRF